MPVTEGQIPIGVPGPRSQALNLRRERAVARGVGVALPIALSRGEGATVEDLDGNLYIDFAGGIATLNVGHCNEVVVRAVHEQVTRFLHGCFSVTMYEPYIELAERLAALTPGNWPKKAAFFNSGAEAVENAVKIARHYTGRPGILVFDNAFHGRTLLTMTMTGKAKPYKLGFGPFAPEVHRVPFCYCYRCAYGLSYPACAIHCLKQIDQYLTTLVDPEEVAAVVIEPVQGEGGFIVPVREFVVGLKALCEEHGILFIADEIQSGYGRTGKMFAIEHFGVTPDLITVAKSMAAGLPLSGVVGRAEVMDAPQAGGIGGTFSGNPVSCVAALAVLDLFESQAMLRRACALGTELHRRFQDLQVGQPLIGEVRGLGPMIALELVRDRETREPDSEAASGVVREAYRRGLLLLSAGLHNNVIRVMAPLVISSAQLEQGLSILQAALTAEQTQRGSGPGPDYA